MSTLTVSKLQSSDGGGVEIEAASLNGGQLAGLRNRIINGDFRVDQYSQGSAFTINAGNFGYQIDRWFFYSTGANVTGQRIAVAGNETDPYRAQVTGAASVTSAGIVQRIEALNCRDLAGKTVTLSVNLSNSLLTTVNWVASYPTTLDAYGTFASPTETVIASGSFTVNSTYSRYSTQINIPVAAVTGLEITFSVGAQTSGTWVIGQVQLEEGPAATPFEKRPYGLEADLCYRYALRGVTSVNLNQTGVTANTSFSAFFPVPMRITPTITGWTVSFSNAYGWTGFQNTAGGSWAGNVAYFASAEF